MRVQHWIATAALAITLIGCGAAPKPTFFDLKPQEKIAIGQFAVNGDIISPGAERRKPGVLQKKSEFYKNSQNAIDSAAQLFFAALPQELPDLKVVTMAEQSANAEYQKVSRPTSRKIMGIGVSEDDGYVYPEAIGYVGPTSSDKIEKMMAALQVDNILLVDIDANIVTGSVNVNGIGPKTIESKVQVSLYKKGQGLTWVNSYRLTGNETTPGIMGGVIESTWPRLLVSSLQDLPKSLAQSLAKGRSQPAVEAAPVK